jgi:hypothetical protein
MDNVQNCNSYRSRVHCHVQDSLQVDLYCGTICGELGTRK